MAMSNGLVNPKSDEAKQEELKRAARRRQIRALVMLVLFIVGCIATLGPIALVPTVTPASLGGLRNMLYVGVLALLVGLVLYFRS